MGLYQEIVLALGSNLGFGQLGPKKTLVRAVTALAESGLMIRRVSRFFETPCFPAGAGPNYVNAGVVLWSRNSPAQILTLLHKVEADFARSRGQRWGMRSLDLDLILVGQQILPDRPTWDHWCNLPLAQQMEKTPDRLILPHPRLQDRPFVLVPLADVVPDWKHPVLGLTIRQMRDNFSEKELAEVKVV